MKAVKLAAFGAVMGLAVALSACAPQPEAGAPQPEAGASEDVIEIRLSHALETSHPQHAGAEKFAELVEELTKGRVAVTVYPQAQLGGDEGLQESVSNNTIEMAVVGNTAALQPSTALFRLPFLFEDDAHAFKVLDGELGAEVFAPLLENDIRVLAVYHNGFRQVTNSKRPLETVEDFAGLKLRVPGSDVYMNLFNALGTNPTPMDFTEVYTALEQGVIDGQENPLAVIVSNRLFEVQDYLAITNHMYTAAPLIINETFWQGLDPELQELVLQAAEESRDFEREEFISAEGENLQTLLDSGMEVTTLSQPELQARAESVYGLFLEQFPESEDVLQAIRDAS